MWIRFVQDGQGYNNGDIVDSISFESGKEVVNSGEAIRVLGPSGKIFEESSPEDIITALAAQDGLSFTEEEEKIRNEMASMTDDQKRAFMLGQFIP